MAIFDYRRKDIIWTASDYEPSVAYEEFPYIELREFEQTFSATMEGINYWAHRIVDPKGAYSGLYMGAARNTYYLPFFMDTHHTIRQNWRENQDPLGDTIKGLAQAAKGVAKVYFPAADILYPKSYAGATEYAYEVAFHLINTTGGSEDITKKNIEKNKQFLEAFIKQNLHVQQNTLTITPPCLYEAYVPGVRWSPVCVVSNLSVTNKGTLNRMPEFGNYIIPDAWEVRIQFRELINESRDIYGEAIRGAESIDNITVRVLK